VHYIDEGPRGAAISDIDLADVDLWRSALATLLRDGLQTIEPSRAELQPGAAPCECDGRGGSDPAGGTGDHHHRSLEPHGCSLGSA